MITGLLLSVRMRALLHKIAETPLRGRVKALNPLQKFILSRESVLNVIPVTFPVEATPNTGLCFSTGQRVHVCVLPMTWERLCMCVCVCVRAHGGEVWSLSLIPPEHDFFFFSFGLWLLCSKTIHAPWEMLLKEGETVQQKRQRPKERKSWKTTDMSGEHSPKQAWYQPWMMANKSCHPFCMHGCGI